MAVYQKLFLLFVAIACGLVLPFNPKLLVVRCTFIDFTIPLASKMKDVVETTLTTNIQSQFLSDKAAQARLLKKFWSDALLEILNEFLLALLIIIGGLSLLVVTGFVVTYLWEGHTNQWMLALVSRRVVVYDEENTMRSLRPALSSPLRRSSTGKTVHWADHDTHPHVELRERVPEEHLDICKK